MATTITTPHRQSVSFRWDSDLVTRLKEMAKREKRSLSNLTETLLSYAIDDEEEPNEETYAALQEAKERRKRLAQGLPVDDNYVDMSSVDAMVKSILR